MRHDVDARVQPAQPLRRHLDLRAADVARLVEHLTLQVRHVDDVVIHEAEPAYAGSGEVERERAPEPAGSDQQHARLEELLLSLETELRQREVASVALELVRAERRRAGRPRARVGGLGARHRAGRLPPYPPAALSTRTR